MRPTSRVPRRGEIWFAPFPTDPPGKGLRPVIVVSPDARNRHDKVSGLLVIPMTTSIQRPFPTHMRMEPGETGLNEICAARAEDVCVVLKTALVEPRRPLRSLSDQKVCELAALVKVAMGCG